MNPSGAESGSETDPKTISCVICDKAAVGRGPFAERYFCSKHLNVDVADARMLMEQVDEELRTYSQANAEGASNFRRNLLQRMLDQKSMEDNTFDKILQSLNSLRSRVTDVTKARIETATAWQLDLEDIENYKQEVAVAEAAGDMSELVQLALSMELSLPDLKTDFDRVQKLVEEDFVAEQQLEGLRRLENLVDKVAAAAADLTVGSRDAAVSARTKVIDCATTANGSVLDPIVYSHEVKLDANVYWLVVCQDTSGFVAEFDRVVPRAAAFGCGEALPQPCIFAVVESKNAPFQVLSVDGTQQLQCKCSMDWKKGILGLLCDRQLLFIAQVDAVTVTDLSGRMLRRFKPNIEGFSAIKGIGGNADSVFVSGGNKIVALSKATGQMETVITLSQLPGADLGNLLVYENCILVIDFRFKQVHRLRIDNQQLVASHPTQWSDLKQFDWPIDVAIDRRGRLFVSEWKGHSVRAVAADDGSLLWTLGVPGESGSGDGRLNRPCGLAVVTVGRREQLVVADRKNCRLVVLNVD